MPETAERLIESVAPPAARAQGLAGRDFLAAFAADLTPRTITFTIAGQPAEVTLQAMGQEDLTTYAALRAVFGMRAQDAKRPIAELAEEASELNLLLVSRTVRRFLLWEKAPARNGKRNGRVEEEEGWQQVVAPEDAEQRGRWIHKRFKGAAPEFWDALVYECLEENHLLEEQEGNSP